MSGHNSPAFDRLCQAHRTHAFELEIPSGNEDEVYRICRVAERRLRAGTLRPIELFNLVALHGLEPGGYVGTKIKAYYRYHSNGRPEHLTWRNLLARISGRRLPDPDAHRSAPGLALDSAAFRWAYDQIPDDAASVVKGVSLDALLAEIVRRAAAGIPEHAECCYYKILGLHGDERAANWIRSCWQLVGSSRMSSLVQASTTCLPLGECIEHFLRAIRRIPPGDREFRWVAVRRLTERLDPNAAFTAATSYIALLPKRDVARCGLYVLSTLGWTDGARERILGWIEDNAFEHDLVDPEQMTPHPVRTVTTQPMFEAFGQLASVCCISWPRVLSWLGRGKPLSRVAIDALLTCGAIDAEKISGAVLKLPRPLRDPPDVESITTILRAYAKQDPDPAIRRKLSLIIDNWPSVLAGASVGSDDLSIKEVVHNLDRALGFDPLR